MLHDTGERYLSTPLFEDITEEMTADEIEISCSTPSYRFDQPAPTEEDEPTPPAAPTVVKLDPIAEQYVDEVVAGQSVVMFALEWCEFCWSVRKLFAAMNIPYKSVDLDSLKYQEGDLGGKIRGVLHARTGQPTIPQIYIGGEHIGGATDIFDECKEGTMQERLVEQDVDYDRNVDVDPYSLLPNWLHPRHSAA